MQTEKERVEPFPLSLHISSVAPIKSRINHRRTVFSGRYAVRTVPTDEEEMAKVRIPVSIGGKRF